MRWAFAVMVMVGCAKSASVACDNGRTCPQGTLCDTANGGCITQSQIDACAGHADHDPCELTNSAIGECLSNVCLGDACLDGRRSGPEQCDPSSDVTQTTCDSPELGYYETTGVRCGADCRWDIATAGCLTRCGDGMIQGNELCETGIPIVGSCLDFGFDRGDIGCAACAPQLSQCHQIGWRAKQLAGLPGGAYALGADVYLAGDGSSGAAYRYHNGLWTSLGFLKQTPTGNNLPTEVVFAESATSIWVGGLLNGGPSGFVGHYDGASWTFVQALTGEVVAIWAGGGHVFAVTDDGKINHFDGTTWSAQTIAASQSDYTIAGRSPTDVWVTGDALYHGGATSTFATVSLPNGLATAVDVYGTDGVAVVVRNTPTLSEMLFLQVSGNWVGPYDLPRQKMTRASVRAFATDDVYVLAKGIDPSSNKNLAVVAHWDGSGTFTTIADSNLTFFANTFAVSPEAGVVAFDPVVIRSFHFPGSAWLTQTGQSAPFDKLVGFDVQRIFAEAAGGYDRVQHFNGQTWAPSAGFGHLDAATSSSIYSFDEITTPQKIWKAGAGNTWTSKDLPAPSSGAYTKPFAVAGVDDAYITLASTTTSYWHWNGTILESTNLPAQNLFEAIDCSSGAGCYAVGPPGIVWHTPGDRNAWAQVDTGVANDNFNTVWMAGAGSVFIGSSEGTITWLDNGTWKHATLPDAPSVTAITGTSATDVFVLARGQAGFTPMFHFNGSTWSRVRTATPDIGYDINSVWASKSVVLTGGGAPATLNFDALVRTTPW